MRIHGFFVFTIMNIHERRTEIDAIDTQIVELLSRRIAVAKDIARLKLAAGLPICDPSREQDVVDRAKSLANSRVSETAVESIFDAILEESKRVQSVARAELLGFGVVR